MNIEEIRKHFPYLDSGKIYFNHAAISPLSNFVKVELEQFLHERSTTDIDNYEKMVNTVGSLTDRISVMLNAKPDRIALTKSVTESLNILAQGIKWEKGDRIILNDIEFPANVYPFLNLKNYGVEVDFVKSKNGEIKIEDIEKLITPKTKLLSISFVQFLTGFRADLETIGELCSKHNIIFSVDAIQGAGVIQLDVEKYKIDFLAGGSHKWLMGLTGLGYLFITEKLQSKLEQKSVGWLSVENEWDLLNYSLELKQTALRFQLGTFSFSGVVALNASLEFFESLGYVNIEDYILQNSKYFLAKLVDEGFKPILRNLPEKNLAGIVTFPVENAEEVFKQLLEKNIVGSLREGMIRFSPHFYNTKEEIDIVVDKLKRLI